MGRTRKMLGISLVVLFVMSLLVMAVSAQPNDNRGAQRNDNGGSQPNDNGGMPGVPKAPSKEYGMQQENTYKQQGKTFSGGQMYFPQFCYRCCWYWDYNYDQWQFRCYPYRSY
jgi:hypothetical protein